MVQPLHNDADCVQQRHLRLRKLYLLNESHQPLQYRRSKRQEVVSFEFPLIRHVNKFPTSRHTNDLVIKRIASVEKMLVDLVYDWLSGFGYFDTYPLRDYDGNAAADDVVTGFPLLRLSDQGILDEGIEVETIYEDIRC
jgi:hypothetical protein